MPTAFGAKIKEYCNLIGLNLKGLAGELGIKPPHLSHWLKGKNDNDANPPQISRQNARLIIQILVAKSAITTRDQAQELLELAFPDQLTLQNFTKQEQEESWYISLSEIAVTNTQTLAAINSSNRTRNKKKADDIILAVDSDVYSTSITRPITPLIGREKELKYCVGQLKSKDTRLLVLVGTGGVGKTRLGLEIAHELQERGVYQDGVHYFSLDALNFGHEIAPLLCEAFDLVAAASEEADGEYIRLLVNYLRTSQLLLVLDNFEQLIDEVSIKLLTTLLGKTQNLRILATSRERLGFEGEQVIELDGLPLPPVEIDRKKPETLLKYGAIELFVLHAKNNKRSFIFDHENAEQIAELCEILDGLPLALELAGTLIATYCLEELLSPDESPLFDVDSSILNTLPPRQRNLIRLMDWSYKKLAEVEKLIFSQIGVFRGGCTVEAMLEICLTSVGEAADDGGQLASSTIGGNRLRAKQKLTRILDRLVAKSLLKTQPDSQRRYKMLWTIREYARLSLTATASENDVTQLHERHADYYLRLAKEAEPFINQQASQEWLTKLKKEQGNLQAGLDYYIAHGKTTKAYELAASLGPYWFRTKTFNEGVKWSDRVLQLSGSGELPELAAQAELFHQTGRLYNFLRIYPKATQLFKAAERIWRELNQPNKLALTLSGLANIAFRQTSYDEANKIYQELNYLATQANDDYACAIAISGLANTALTTEKHDQAKVYYEQFLKLGQKLANESFIATALKSLGQLAGIDKDYVTALSLHTKSLEIYQKLKQHIDIADVTLLESKINYFLGDYKGFISQTLYAAELVKNYDCISLLPFCFLNFALGFGIIIKDAKQATENLIMLEKLSLDHFDSEDKKLHAEVCRVIGSGFSRDVATDKNENHLSILDNQIKALRLWESREKEQYEKQE